MVLYDFDLHASKWKNRREEMGNFVKRRNRTMKRSGKEIKMPAQI